MKIMPTFTGGFFDLSAIELPSGVFHNVDHMIVEIIAFVRNEQDMDHRSFIGIDVVLIWLKSLEGDCGKSFINIFPVFYSLFFIFFQVYYIIGVVHLLPAKDNCVFWHFQQHQQFSVLQSDNHKLLLQLYLFYVLQV